MVIYIGALAYLCFGHFSNVPDLGRKLLGLDQDKIFHFCMFFPFPILTYFSYGKEFKTPWKAILFILVTFLIGSAMGGSTEIIQGMTTWRSADPKDFLADAVGVASASLLTFVFILVRETRKASGR